MKIDPKRPDKHIDPATGIWPISEWGGGCGRGWVSDARFGSGQVIKRTGRKSRRTTTTTGTTSTRTGGDK